MRSRVAILAALLTLAACDIDITWPEVSYGCFVVDSLPPESARDTTWVKCADPGSLPDSVVP